MSTMVNHYSIYLNQKIIFVKSRNALPTLTKALREAIKLAEYYSTQEYFGKFDSDETIQFKADEFLEKHGITSEGG